MKNLIFATLVASSASLAAAAPQCHLVLNSASDVTLALDYQVQQYGASHASGTTIEAVPAVLTLSRPGLTGTEQVEAVLTSQDDDRGQGGGALSSKTYALSFSHNNLQFGTSLDGVQIAIRDGAEWIRRTSYDLRLTVDGVALPPVHFDLSQLPDYCAN